MATDLDRDIARYRAMEVILAVVREETEHRPLLRKRLVIASLEKGMGLASLVVMQELCKPLGNRPV